MDLLGPVLEIILSCWGPISRQIGYLKNLNYNMLTLQRETNELKHMHDEVQANVKDAVRVGKLRVPRVDDWLKDVGNFATEVESMRTEFDDRHTCLNGCSIDHFSRYRLGKRIVKKTEFARELTMKGVFDKVATSPPRSLERQTSVSHQNQRTFEQTLKKIWQSIHDEENAIICVCGIGGVGKTTLMKAINDRFIGTTDFDVVMWVTVTQDLELELIQGRIGSQLGIEFKADEDKRSKLSARLKNIRYMLILDDVWKAFSLSDVGIPKPDKQNRCKIAITTRSIEVCNDMGANKKVRIGTLTDEEAWSLFHEKAGDVVLLPGIWPLAKKVLKECSGLPLAVKVVGQAMKEKNKKELWENALRALQSPGVSEVRGMEREVFLPLKHSYDSLKDPKLQSCFLYCSLFPDDYEISTYELARYWAFEEGLIDNNINTLQETINEGYANIDRLKDWCLLEEGLKSNQCVRMHDLIRDLALRVSSLRLSSSTQAKEFFVKAGEGLEHPPGEKMWEGVKRISLIKTNIKELQIKPNCPDLVTLLLRDNYRLGCIHDNFLQFMPQLQILDLSNTGIDSLPASLSLLVNLRALICRECYYLGKIPPLRKLKELQVLDFFASPIETLPEGNADLVKLRQLYLDRHNLATLPCNLISGLTSLEDLTLSGYDDSGIDTLREATALPSLTTFRICLHNFDGFTSNGMNHKFWAGLRRFEVAVGDNILSYMMAHNEPYDKIIRICRQQSLPPGIEGLMRHAERLRMVECGGVADLTQLICSSGSLRNISVCKSQGLECIINWREVGRDALDCLEILRLRWLSDLKKVFNVEKALLPPTRFQHLKIVHIFGCPRLKCVFPFSMVGHLHQLQMLFVAQCDGMEEIIEGDMLPEDALPRLTILIMKELSKLKSICSQRVAFTSMKWIEVSICPELKKLPVLSSETQRIGGRIEGTKEWWEGMEWVDDDHSKSIYGSISPFEFDSEDGDQVEQPRILGETRSESSDEERSKECHSQEGKCYATNACNLRQARNAIIHRSFKMDALDNGRSRGLRM